MARGGRGGGNRGSLPRGVQVSKKLSWLLRHGAEQEGLRLGEGGFGNMQDVLDNCNLRSLKVTFDEVRQIVRDNDKQRFTMVPVSTLQNDGVSAVVEGPGAGGEAQSTIPSDNPKDWLIRANQGHSLKVDSDGLLQPITAEDIPHTAVHGTTHAAWPLIVASGGLKPMGRNHVHFASGLPAGFQSVVQQDVHEVQAPVISGMRKSSTVLMFLHVRKAMDAGLKFWRSDNGVILADGGEQGLVSLDFFERVEDRTGVGVLLEDGKIIKDPPTSWKSRGEGKG